MKTQDSTNCPLLNALGCWAKDGHCPDLQWLFLSTEYGLQDAQHSNLAETEQLWLLPACKTPRGDSVDHLGDYDGRMV